MDAQKIQQTSSAISQIFDSFANSNTLIFLSVIYGVGMGLKSIPKFPNDKIPLFLTLFGSALGAFTFQEFGIKKAIMIGFGAVSVCVYCNQLILNTFPNNKLAQILAGEFNFSNKKNETP